NADLEAGSTSVLVRADALTGPAATADSVSGHAASASDLTVTAQVIPAQGDKSEGVATWAYVGAGATVVAGGLDVEATASHGPTATGALGGLAGLSGSGLRMNAQLAPDVDAFLGPRAKPTGTGLLVPATSSGSATTINVPGTVRVKATSFNGGTTSVEK